MSTLHYPRRRCRLKWRMDRTADRLFGRLHGSNADVQLLSKLLSSSAAQQLSNSAHTSSAAEHGKSAPGLRTICAERNTIMPTTTSRPHTHMEDTAAGRAGVRGKGRLDGGPAGRLDMTQRAWCRHYHAARHRGFAARARKQQRCSRHSPTDDTAPLARSLAASSNQTHHTAETCFTVCL